MYSDNDKIRIHEESKYKMLSTNIIIKILLLIMLIVLASIFANKKSYAASWEDSSSHIMYEYELDNAGNAINVKITTAQAGNYTIPSQIDGRTVISLGDGVNRICGTGEDDELVVKQRFTLPNTVKRINANAFKDCIVENKSFSQIEEIGDNAFLNSRILRSNSSIAPSVLDLTNAKIIGDSAFEQNNDSHFNGGGPYDHWSYLDHYYTKIQFGNNLKELGEKAFSRQGWLREVNIPASTEKIGMGAFNLCRRLNALSFDESRALPLEIGDEAFRGIANTNIEIKQLYKLGSNVFYDSAISSAKIEDGVTKIEPGTFEHTKLAEIEIPETLVEIGDNAFNGTLLDNDDYNYLLGKSVESIGSYAFAGTDLSGEIIVPNKIRELGVGVFSGCTNITKATIQMDNISRLPGGIFENCISLSEVNLPESITEIGDKAFYACKSLDLNMLYNNILPSNKSNLVIGKSAFEDCVNLKGELTVPINISSIGENAFRGCTGLSGTLSIKDNLERIEAGTFSKCTNIEKIDLQPHTTELYIGDSAFDGDSKVESIIVNGNITEIGSSAFANMPNAKEVKFNAGDAKENIVIFGQISSIGSYAFYNTAVSEKIVRMRAPIEYIGTRIFSNPTEIFTTSFMPDTKVEFRWQGDANPIIHQKGYHNIEVECMLPGITVTDSNGNIVNGQDLRATCEGDFTLKFTVSNEYANKYPELAIKVISQGEYLSSDFVEEYITLDENNSYTFKNITRDKKVVVQRSKDGTDLVLRQFISKVNNKTVTRRAPKISINTLSAIPKFEYKHTKEPIIVQKNNIVTYTIRVYNEGNKEGNANEITVRLPERLSFVENNSVNNLYGWTASEDNKKVIKTQYLKDKAIEAYAGYGKPQNGRNIYGKPQYEELKIECKVEEPIDDQQYLVMVSEISDGNDVDSLPNNSDTIDLKKYMIDDSNASDQNSYVKGIEDDTDHEILIMEGKTKVGYDLVINKIDLDTAELLDGAKMRLYDENGNIIKDVITQNGIAEFGGFCSYGEGTDTYYVEEVETPSGYSRTIDGKIKLEVVKVLNEDKEMNVTIKCEVEELETEYEDSNIEYIPISTAEQFMKIGTGETVSINGKDYVFAEKASYKLQNDIDFSSLPPMAPIKYMEGFFDGNGKTITDAKIIEPNSGNGAGLFQTYSGVIKRLNLNITIASSSPEVPDSIYGKHAVGGLVGYMVEGRIDDCNVNFNVANSNTSENVGGLIGHTHPDKLVIVKKCNVVFNNTSPCQNIGGIIGCVGGNAKIIECSNEGSNFGAARISVGGFVGYSAEGGRAIFEKCVNKSSFGGETNIGGLIGCAMGAVQISECSNEGNIGNSR